MNAQEAQMAQLSALVKAHLPEGSVNSKQFTTEVIEDLQKPGAEERLKEAIARADRASNLHRHVDVDALRTQITGPDHSD